MRMSKRRLTVAVAAVGLIAAGGLPALAKGGPGGGGGGGGATSAGTISVSPSTVTAGSVANYVLRYQAKGGFSDQVVSFGIPNGFTTPTIGGSGPGAVSVLKGTCTVVGSPIVVFYQGQYYVQMLDVSCPKGGNFAQIGYNNATAPTFPAGSYLFGGFEGNTPQPAAPATVSVVAAAPYRLFWDTSPNNVFAGQLTSPQQVEVLDQYNNRVLNAGGSVALALFNSGGGPATATTTGTWTQPVVNGVATFGDLKVLTANIVPGYQFKASDGLLPTLRSGGFSVSPGTATQLVFLSQPQNTTAGNFIDASSGGVRVAIEDAFGNVRTGDSASSVSLALVSPPAGITLGGTTAQLVSSGVATFPDLSFGRSNPGNVLRAGSGALPTTDSSAFDVNWLITPATGAGNWRNTQNLGLDSWWLFEYQLPDTVVPDVPPNLGVSASPLNAESLNTLVGSGASGFSWAQSTTDDRALENSCFGDIPCGALVGLDPTIPRSAGTLFSSTTLSTSVHFPSVFTGRLTLYAVDWDLLSRDETVVVHDALGDQTVHLTQFGGGVYASFIVTTGDNSNVTITVNNNNALANGVLSAVFVN